MAPTINRRSGHSRRAQYGTFIGYSAGVLGAIVGAVILAVSLFNPDAFSGIRSMAATASEPAGIATSHARSQSRGIFAGIAAYFAAGSKNARLERELNEAKVRLAEADAMRAENKRLRKLLDLADPQVPPVAVTRITSSNASGSRRFATIGSGLADGVEKGMPVRSELGLVGRVLDVGGKSARILLLTDTESVVPVRRTRDGIPAFAQGRGDGKIQIKLIDLSVDKIREGDVFVTSGSGGLYRPGTAVGIATRILRDEAIAKVLADPAGTEYVTVEQVWAPEQLQNTIPEAQPRP